MEGTPNGESLLIGVLCLPEQAGGGFYVDRKTLHCLCRNQKMTENALYYGDNLVVLGNIA